MVSSCAPQFCHDPLDRNSEVKIVLVLTEILSAFAPFSILCLTPSYFKPQCYSGHKNTC